MRIHVDARQPDEVNEPEPQDEDINDIRTLEDAQRDGIDAETRLKQQLANRTFAFMERFVALVFLFLTCYICYFIWYRLEIPKEVIIALITTTLAAVVGLVGFILKGLFGNNQ